MATERSISKRRRSWPTEMKREIAGQARSMRAEGMSWSDVCRELNVLEGSPQFAVKPSPCPTKSAEGLRPQQPTLPASDILRCCGEDAQERREKRGGVAESLAGARPGRAQFFLAPRLLAWGPTGRVPTHPLGMLADTNSGQETRTGRRSGVSARAFESPAARIPAACRADDDWAW